MTPRDGRIDDDDFWRENYRGSAYVDPRREYEYYQPAYRFGWESYSRYGRRSFAELDGTLRDEWERGREPASPSWEEAREAARDAWDRVARHERPVVEPSADPDPTGRG